MNLIRIVAALLIVLAVALLFVRVVVPFVRRVTMPPSTRTVVPGEVVPEQVQHGIPRALRHGYDAGDVDALFERVYALAADPSGRAEALALIRAARFHLERNGGYEPLFVDDRVDAIADALASGRELPPRPDLR